MGKTRTLQTLPYENCKIYSPDGVLLSRVSKKRIDWFLGRNLAIPISETEIKLNFQPKAMIDVNHPFYNQDRENKCVVCGNSNDLTKHHIVPLSYRKYFPAEKRQKDHHDILPVCLTCHQKYEPLAETFKKLIAAELKIPHQRQMDRDLHRAISSACALTSKHKNKIPLDKYYELLNNIKTYLHKNNIEHNDLVELKKRNAFENSIIPEKMIVEKADIDILNQCWRQHFVTNMQPAYLPPFWSIDHI